MSHRTKKGLGIKLMRESLVAGKLILTMMMLLMMMKKVVVVVVVVVAVVVEKEEQKTIKKLHSFYSVL